MFEAFYRVSESRERKTGGYGVGLAIAKQVSTAHKGNIEAQNHPQGGLMVSLRLPLEKT
ncbi:MAG: ATP-binding protein [Mariprofundaceae bacterium]|nr:ATP-binding protein [Mariprofundaceae bacterium]